MLIGEGGYQEFSLTPEVSWLPVVVALVLGVVIGGTAVALVMRGRRSPAAAASQQDHCDWCYSSVSDSARERSMALGLDREYSLACERCLGSGRVREKPDGWDDEAEWPWAAPASATPVGEWAERIEVAGLEWDAAAPMPVLISSDHRTLFACHLQHEDVVVVAEFVRCTSVRKGLPNDEVAHGLPFKLNGLYDVNVIHGSRWLHELQQIESVHQRSAGHPIFSERRHYLLGLHDCSLEAIAKDLVVIGKFPTMDDAIAEMVRLTA